MDYVHVSEKVESRIEALRRTGKTGAALAQKASRVIEGLASGTAGHRMGGVTKYGEKRIRNCRKFDLGSGFRLITLQRGLKVFIPFLGTHDECQRWLENNSRLKGVTAARGTLYRVPASLRQFDKVPEMRPDDSRPAPESGATLQVSDRDLRRIFSGIVAGAGSPLR